MFLFAEVDDCKVIVEDCCYIAQLFQEYLELASGDYLHRYLLNIISDRKYKIFFWTLYSKILNFIRSKKKKENRYNLSKNQLG